MDDSWILFTGWGVVAVCFVVIIIMEYRIKLAFERWRDEDTKETDTIEE